uniref:Uncharacterized protein n=1 Tax=Romanomermis culicivorax TaxID=13658 RepID=A0A915JT09_ROMCU
MLPNRKTTQISRVVKIVYKELLLLKGDLYLPFPTERNEPECNRHNLTGQKGNFRSVRLEINVGYFIENFSCPFRSKMELLEDRPAGQYKGHLSASSHIEERRKKKS